MEQTFLFPKDWAALDELFAIAARVPSDPPRFLDRYGSFDNTPSIDAFTGAIGQIQQVTAELGGPETNKQSSHPPADIYSSIVQVSMQAGNLADTISSTLESLPDAMRSAPDDPARPAKELLAGSGGVADQADAIAKTIRQIADKTATYAPRLNSAILAIHKSEVVNQANRALSDSKAAKPDLQKKAAEAEEKAKGWFGGAKAKAELERLQQEIGAVDAELQKKELLNTDLGEFFLTGNEIAPAISSIVARLRALAKTFQDTAERIRDTFRLADRQQLADPSWLARALGTDQEVERWKEFRGAAQRFAQGSLVAAGD